MKSSSLKKVAVTGGSSGIGLACVQSFLHKGFDVISIDKAPISENMSRHVLTDLSSMDNLLHLADSFAEYEVDILINAAGIREITPVNNLSLEKWSEVLLVNLTAPFLLSQAVAKSLISRQKPGAIVNIASVSGIMAEPERAAYVSSKHGLVGLTKQLAMEYGEYGVRVNAVAPGVVKTPMTESYFDDAKVFDLISKAHAMKRCANPCEIASVVGFIASEQASFMTGAIVPVDGGWTAGKVI